MHVLLSRDDMQLVDAQNTTQVKEARLHQAFKCETCCRIDSNVHYSASKKHSEVDHGSKRLSAVYI